MKTEFRVDREEFFRFVLRIVKNFRVIGSKEC